MLPLFNFTILLYVALYFLSFSAWIYFWAVTDIEDFYSFVLCIFVLSVPKPHEFSYICFHNGLLFSCF